MSCFSESDIIPVVLDIIKENPGIRTSEIIEEARCRMNPDGEDLEILDGRMDDKFSQKVRNIRSHRSIKDQVITTDERDCQWFPREE